MFGIGLAHRIKSKRRLSASGHPAWGLNEFSGVASGKSCNHHGRGKRFGRGCRRAAVWRGRSEEHTSELQSLMRISYAVFCLQKKNTQSQDDEHHTNARYNLMTLQH